MRDLKNPRLIWLKGVLFLVIGVLAAVLLFIESPTWRAGFLLALTIWAFCRAYYFAFYVIERYVDPAHHFSGLISFARYVLQKSRSPDP